MKHRIYRGTFEIPDERDFLTKIREISESSSVFIVFFDKNAIAGCDHIRAALSFAERSFFEYRNPVSKFFEMEVLLYAFGTRQTGFASGFGIHRGHNDSLILICRKDEESEESALKAKELFDSSAAGVIFEIAGLDECTGNEIQILTKDSCLVISTERSDSDISRLAKIFDITTDEIEICGKDRLEELVIERCALLDVNR